MLHITMARAKWYCVKCDTHGRCDKKRHVNQEHPDEVGVRIFDGTKKDWEEHTSLMDKIKIR